MSTRPSGRLISTTSAHDPSPSAPISTSLKTQATYPPSVRERARNTRPPSHPQSRDGPIEREINGRSAAERLAHRQTRIALLIAELEAWMRAERVRLSRHAETAKAIDYMLKRWPAFTRFLDDGRICLSNNAAERALRGIALGRKSWLFAGSD